MAWTDPRPFWGCLPQTLPPSPKRLGREGRGEGDNTTNEEASCFFFRPRRAVERRRGESVPGDKAGNRPGAKATASTEPPGGCARDPGPSARLGDGRPGSYDKWSAGKGRESGRPHQAGTSFFSSLNPFLSSFSFSFAKLIHLVCKSQAYLKTLAQNLGERGRSHGPGILL